MIKGSLQMKILYRGVIVEDGPKIDGFGGLDRESCECESSAPPRKSNYNETRHPVQNFGDTPKNVFSRASQEKL